MAITMNLKQLTARAPRVTDNFDEGVTRSWYRVGQAAKCCNRGLFHWGMVDHDPLLARQCYMMREGRHSLHNMIRGDHGLPNRY